MSHKALCITLFSLLALGACSNNLDGADRKPDNDEDPDRDGDGYPLSRDCDDDDKTVYPGAPELCDGKDNDCDGVIPEDETDLDNDGVIECDEVCGAGPGAGNVTKDTTCEYVPASSGKFSARVEWSMAQAMRDPTTGIDHAAWTFDEYPELGSVMQAPVVGQATDDNRDGSIDGDDIPDIAVVMGHDRADKTGVIRLISGDGTIVHATMYSASHTNNNGTFNYAPYHHAGVAMADIDNDGRTELVTMVTRTDVVDCYPAIYEVVQDGADISIELQDVYGGGDYYCGAHGPAIADIDDDGNVDIILGRNALENDLTLKWSAPGGRGWYSAYLYGDGYWNSGYHSFPYEMDGDARTLEVVAGSNVFTHEGAVLCELGHYEGSAWVKALDGYPAVADILRFSGDEVGEPEIVLTGNNKVSVYHGVPDYDPNGQARCLLIDQLPNDPYLDPAVASDLPTHPNCARERNSWGGQPTVADFDGDGDNEIGVAGACWYSVYRFNGTDLERYALAQTKDWSSASTGSTVFDFNGDDRAEIIFSDEEALYVWHIDRDRNAKPWERLVPLLTDTNHKSWTIHEYPLVVDLDADGKAEILVANAHQPDFPDHYGLYVLGAEDDDWVSARRIWNQHAYHVTNVNDDGEVDKNSPNYLPYMSSDLNNFRTQAPGRFGAKKAPNLRVTAEPPCQEGCGDIRVWVQVINEGAYITIDPSTKLSLYGVKGSTRTELQVREVGQSVAPGERTAGIRFDVSDWGAYDHLVAVIDDPDQSPSGWGTAKECDETDNEVIVKLEGVCP